MAVPTNDIVMEKCEEKAIDMEDWISKLPDEILISILSLMPMKDAAKTSVLSLRWKYLWLYVTDSLNFDASDILRDIFRDRKSLRLERYKFVGWVNRVMQLHRGSKIGEFRVRFDLNNRSKHYIDKWIDIAITKNAQVLELDLTPVSQTSILYSFPHEFLAHIENYPSYVSWIMSLKSLCLKYVNVTGYLLAYLLSNCPLLERLTVERSETLVYLNVGGSSLLLNYLHISECFALRIVEINAPNLVTFKYEGETTAFHIESAPRLRDLTICGYYNPPVTSASSVFFSSYFSQVETLTLGMFIFKEDQEFQQLPMLPNLKYLTWNVLTRHERSLLGLTSLIEAAPFLQRFTLEVNYVGPREYRTVQTRSTRYRNEHLKVVEINGFEGYALDTELAVYFLERATMLEKFVINPRFPFKLGTPREYKLTEMQRAARYHVCLLLQSKLPSGAQLDIL